MSNFLKNLPNYLTYLRLALIPFFVLLLNNPTRSMVNFAILIFIVAAFTDYIDGLIARRWGAVSDFGKILDPLADKILVMAALVMLTSLRSDLYGEPWVPGWMVVFALAREIWVTGLRVVAASNGNIVAAGNAGKWKSFLQMFAIVMLLMHDYPIKIVFFEVSAQLIGVNLLALSLVLSYLSAFFYTTDILFPHNKTLSDFSTPEENSRSEKITDPLNSDVKIFQNTDDKTIN